MMKKGKIMILGLSIVLVVVVLIIGLVTNVNRRKQSEHDSDILSSTTKSVASVCSLTDFKRSCVDSLNSLASNQSATPKDFLQKAIHVAILEVEAVKQRSSSMGERANDSLNRLAVDDCKDLLQFAIDELQASFSSVGDSQLHTINDREEELNNWLSAVVSYQQTCMDGFSQPDLKDAMSIELLNATQLTDNALAIVFELAQVLERFNITIPAAMQSNDTSTATTSRRLLKQDDDDYYPASLSVGDKGRKLLKQDDDDYYPASLSVGDRRRKLLKQDDDDYYPASLSVGDRRRRLLKEEDDDYYPASLSVGDRHRRLLKQDDDDYYPASLSVGDRHRRLLKQDDDDYYPASLSVGDRHRRLLKQDDDDYYPASVSVGDKRRKLLKQDNEDYYPASLSVGDRRRKLLKQDDDDYYPSVSVGDKHRRLLKQDNDDYYPSSLSVGDRRLLGNFRLLNQDGDSNYPSWLSAGDRHLLAAAAKRAPLPTPNAVVAKDGSGKFKTITQALAAYPKQPLTGSTRYVIYVKEGVYEENVIITKDQTNVFIYGDGPRRTRVTGKKSFAAGVPTYQTATFSAIGNGFIAMSMGMANTAGPQGHQAVALRVQSDMAAIYNCRMDGNQDTLYAQTHRQFYRNCVISGTIDFIFGDSSVVLQNCLIIVRKPMDNQQNTVTAQGRAFSHEKTGIVIQNCRIVPDQSLEPLRFKIPTYLGRPWKQYSRAVIMESTLADFIHPDGWLPWAGTFALDTLYFAEHANRGPGANTAKRVRWKGYHVIANRREAIQFTAAPFIQGNQWLKPTGVPYSLDFIRN